MSTKSSNLVPERQRRAAALPLGAVPEQQDLAQVRHRSLPADGNSVGPAGAKFPAR
jgi:hypothetical protein